MTCDIRQIVLLPAVEAAPLLLGAILKVGGCSGRIVEVEAYTQDDPASHSFRGRRPRNEVMFWRGGHLYVYRSYGVHWCANVVTGEEGSGEAVLLRAVEPLTGLPAMRRRRGNVRDRRLCAGPGNVCRAFGLDGTHSGAQIAFWPTSRGICLLPGEVPSAVSIGPRIGITSAEDWPRRFLDSDSRHLSRGPK